MKSRTLRRLKAWRRWRVGDEYLTPYWRVRLERIEFAGGWHPFERHRLGRRARFPMHVRFCVRMETRRNPYTIFQYHDVEMMQAMERWRVRGRRG